jgi:hypothetical protein
LSNSYQEGIRKKKDSVVEKKFFFSRDNDHIGAIWALDINENILTTFKGEMKLIYNPHATSPVPKKFFPANCKNIVKG